ncbi:MAG: YfdX family protein [Gemmataceae bacterium]
MLRLHPRTFLSTAARESLAGGCRDSGLGDQREVQENRIPLFEGMLSAKTLAPIVAAKQEAANNDTNNKQENNKQEAAEIKGVRLVSSETIITQVFADLNVVEAQLMRTVKALDANKTDDADKALAAAQTRGVEFRYNKEDTPLAQARDAMWLAKRSLEENNAAQAQTNLSVARQALRLYREVAPKERLKEVNQMLKEADELDAKLRQETAQQPASSSERMQQGKAATGWWERINQWFRRR